MYSFTTLKASPDSKRLAKTMKKTFESKYDKHQPNRGFTGTVSARNLYVLAQYFSRFRIRGIGKYPEHF